MTLIGFRADDGAFDAPLLVDVKPCSPVWDSILIRSNGFVAVFAIIPAKPPQIIRLVMSSAAATAFAVVDLWSVATFPPVVVVVGGGDGLF